MQKVLGSSRWRQIRKQALGQGRVAVVVAGVVDVKVVLEVVVLARSFSKVAQISQYVGFFQF